MRRITKTVETFYTNIWIAGDFATAISTCRKFCERGLCVTVTPTTYVYTGGLEQGVCVRLINYPRFPSTPDAIWQVAMELGEALKEALSQGSYTIECSDETIFYSTREQDSPDNQLPKDQP